MRRPVPADTESAMDLDAERTVLGICMQDRKLGIARVIDMLKPEDFCIPKHGKVYALLIEMYLANELIEPSTVLQRLSAMVSPASRVTELGYFGGLPIAAVSTSNAPHYAGSVVKMAWLRELTRLGADIQAAGFERRDPEAVMGMATTRLAEIATRRRGNNAPVTIHEAIGLADKARLESPMRVVPTGLTALDRLLAGDNARARGGLRGGELVVIAARPSMGKTSLAVGMLLEHALSGNGRSGFLTLEQDAKAVSDRVLAQFSGISLQSVEVGGFDAEEADRIAQAKEGLRDVPLLLRDPTQASMGTIYETCRRWKAEPGGIDIVGVDYLSLIRHETSGGRVPLNQATGATVKALKQLARELAIPVILCVQINREYTRSRAALRKSANWWETVAQPQMHHLAESGDIERDADMIMFPLPANVLRKQGYAPNLQTPNVDAAVIIVAKNRNGPIGTAECLWSGATTSYHDARAFEPRIQIVGGRDWHDPDDSRDS